MRTHQIISYELVDELLRYDEESRLLYWRNPIGCMTTEAVGEVNENACLRFVSGKKAYPVYLIAWLLFYCEYPKDQIYQGTERRVDDRMSNLHDAPKRSIN